ncbi:MAG: type II toxin-antitoxin system prevent-host-death family antitoxin [Clostridiales Family XIII bacterium]|nr:type II toxin-antitoxin system prevent-host-death family antitoxin [Clostridiales Family XIII bacterium]
MVFMSMRELRSSTEKLDRAVKDGGRVVITNNGKPAYVMLGVDEASFERTIIDLDSIRMKITTEEMRAQSKAAGADKMTLEEINREIEAYRAERRARK